MENRCVVKTVPIPELTAEKPADRLVELYRKVGWDEKNAIVDPCKIRLTESDHQRLLSQEKEHAKKAFPEIPKLEIAFGINMLWLNTGPSGGGNTPGMVELHEGWERI